MRIERTPLDDLWLVDLDVRPDAERAGGSFREIFHAERFAEAGAPAFRPVQWNISESREGTLRGFHAEPWTKLVHPAAGSVFAAIADVRKNSPTAGRTWTGELGRSRALLVGAGLANAFQALSDVAVYAYLVDEHWSATGRYPAVRWDDPDLAVAWPITDDRLALSARDRANPTLRDYWNE
jgi:dTDP-4-dehydrorhamnose 3,5-epimerase